ncbi:hypothetical protein BJF93_00395 [Xaviernesmea oryzae]|uniref:Peptidase S9 prolyl oligopeptidase catalytic domain-containing protein n=1 Tax=Xaviernesmea oryzae TaxID=464029 RepID=A0A1Q9B0H3_9HYPH|nr:prolyl oligopeptidase family serine peptidase [Xaviernesmea oryzae]OLP61434.1 hypothetical protein BJF93_00395 [Xaviernesmea oryzae]SEL69383.1 Prolyl oligopeptidase family protein [Xaviernesmea oryzae]
MSETNETDGRDKIRLAGLSRRQMLAGAGAIGMMPLALSAEAAEEPPLIHEDYGTARRGFRTRLLKKGPAPDQGDPLTPPPEADAIGYGSDGLSLTAWVSKGHADPGRKKPGVLVLHGGNAIWHGHWDLTSAYRKAGYVALMPVLRAENGQDGFFSGFYDEVDDVLAAAQRLRGLPSVDPDRLYLAGHSVGGTLTLLTAQATPLFRAASAFSPNPDARAFFRHFAEDIRFDTTNPREFDLRSPVCFAESFKCPVQMLHGSAETRTDAVIRLTAARAKAKGLDLRHGIVEGTHMSALDGEIAESLAFLKGFA